MALARRVVRQAALIRVAQIVLRRFPKTKMYIKRLVMRVQHNQSYTSGFPSGTSRSRNANLSPSAQTIFLELKANIKNNQ